MAKFDLLSAQERKSQETRRKILEATERLLAEYDFKYLTVRNICTEGDVAYGSFYHHFQSKENLLYIYGKELYQRIQDRNPCPADVAKDDFVKEILWYFVVFGEFCTHMGKDFVHCLYQTASMDLFEHTYDTVVVPLMRRAHENGYIQDFEGISVLDNMIKDTRIVYLGIIMWWCVQPEDAEPLAATLEHLLVHLLSSRKKSRTAPGGGTRRYLLTETDYRKSLDLSGLPVKM